MTVQQKTKLSDDDLMGRINQGDVESSLATLHERYASRIHSYVQKIVGDTHLADDITNEVFAKVFFKSHLYQQGTRFHAWIFEIARNQALSALRSRRLTPVPVASTDHGDRESSPLESIPDWHENRELEHREFEHAFERAVADLPDRYRDVFRMCVQEGARYSDASKELEIPAGTVAIRIMRARRRLFDELAMHIGHVRRPPACVQN